MPSDLHSLVHNAGFDFIRELKHLSESEKTEKISPYFREPIGILFACSSAEGYIYFVGEETQRGWYKKELFNSPIKEKIRKLYGLNNDTPNFSEQSLKDIIDIFKFRNRIAHPTCQVSDQRGQSPVLDVFQEAKKSYPIKRTFKIAQIFRDKLLSDFKVENQWLTRGVNIETDIIRMKD